jgi:AI-2 transport protein TqsA
MPPKLAVLTTGLFGVAALILFGTLVAGAVSAMAENFTAYQEQLNGLMERLADAVPLEGVGLKPNPETGRLFQMSEGAITGFLSLALVEISNLISQGALVVMFTVFILLGRTSNHTQAQGLLGVIATRVKQYISRVMLLAGVTGALVALVLASLGVRFALVFGLFAFLLYFIPVIGSAIATLLPLPVVLLSPELSPTSKVLAIALPATIQFVVGQIVHPKVMGHTLDLHPVVVLLSLLFFQMIWGIGGAFLATPIVAVVKIIFEHFSATQPLSRLLAGDLDALVGEKKPVIVAERAAR